MKLPFKKVENIFEYAFDVFHILMLLGVVSKRSKKYVKCEESLLIINFFFHLLNVGQYKLLPLNPDFDTLVILILI